MSPPFIYPDVLAIRQLRHNCNRNLNCSYSPCVSESRAREGSAGWVVSYSLTFVLTLTCVSAQNPGQRPGPADLSHAVQRRPGGEEHPAVRRVAHPGRSLWKRRVPFCLDRLRHVPFYLVTECIRKRRTKREHVLPPLLISFVCSWLSHRGSFFNPCQDKHALFTTEHKGSLVFHRKGNVKISALPEIKFVLENIDTETIALKKYDCFKLFS